MYKLSYPKLLLYKIALIIPDSIFVRLKYRKGLGKWPNLRNPQTFNEKLNWLKLHDRNPLYTTMVDKYEVKKYIASIIGEEYIIPTLGVWDRAEDIDFDSLPDKFVLKATHDSGRVIICRDKSKLDRAQAIMEMKVSLKRDFYAVTREWPYKNVKPRIIAEQLLEDNGSQNGISDYKVHNFNGVPEAILVCRDRFKSSGLTEDFYTTEWQHLDVRRPGHPNAPEPDECPPSLSKMLQLSERIAEKYPFMRTDFYSVGEKLYFGEITLYPASGTVPFIPKEYDDIFGDKLEIHDLDDNICSENSDKMNDSTDSFHVGSGGGKLLIYSNICIIVRSEPQQSCINDYKFFCFNGKVKFMKVDFDRQTNHGANYYNRNFNLLDIQEIALPRNPNKELRCPSKFNLMIDLAEKISERHRFLRVDFYEINQRVYFGEATFYPNSGNGGFLPDSADLEIGKLLQL